MAEEHMVEKRAAEKRAEREERVAEIIERAGL